MWIISGPFDGESGGDLSFQKVKLLKPKSSYTLGRKSQPLLVNNKKVSAALCQFEVGEHTVDDISDPSSRPSLRIVNLNKKDKGVIISRDGDRIEVAPATEHALQDGDVISLVSGADASVHWKPLCVYAPSSSFPSDQCASLGIKIVHTPHAEVTHHITSDFVANLSSMSSLLSLCQFVKPEWLQEVIKLGTDLKHAQPFGLSSLEEHFVLPFESKYRPAFSPSLSSAQKVLRLWEPNEERVNLFQACRFICLHEKIRDSDTELREAIHRGGGSLENFDIHSGIVKFRRALTRAQVKEGKKTVIVGDEESMKAAVGKETWEEYVAEARSSSLEIFPPSKFIQAILDVNVDILFESNTIDIDDSSTHARTTSLLANTLSKGQSAKSSQPTTTPAPKRLIRRATSREPSAAREPPPEQASEEPPKPPKKTLTRRAVPKKPPVITGIDDPSEIIDAVPELSSAREKTPPPPTPARESTGATAPTPGRPKNLKRRFAGKDKNSALPQMSMLSSIGETVPEEPPLKKFKALFEASGAEADAPAMDFESFNPEESIPQFSVGLSSQTQTQTQAETEPGRFGRGFPSSSLAVLREEEEETQGSSSQRGTKRRADDEEEDVEMQLVQDRQPSEASSGPPMSKRRAVENVNAVENVARGASKPPSTVGTVTLTGKEGHGAAPGKPDTDAAFLKAIASTKRGKKGEDDFDREFNKLKISKPQLNKPAEPEEEWAVLAEFGDDSGLRGNFMVVVEIDVYKKNPKDKENQVSNQAWNGKPNFKKFKKKVNNSSRAKIDLFVNDDNDYDTWAAGDSQGRTQTQTQVRLPDSQIELEVQPLRTQTQHKTRNGRSQIAIPSDDSDVEEARPAPSRKTRKAPSRAGSATPGPSRTTSRSKAPARAKAKAQLFLDSDNDDEVYEIPGHDDDDVVEEETLKSSPEELRAGSRRTTSRTTAAAKSKSKKAAPIILDDGSDDDAVFKGFGARRGGR
ncbi:unnamed protein product [Cyclocybe aegerita]|uniref:Nibrin second BRCT domain-containing protein n=1 Tax=Cyclocybe aegerita TaxID=1973307 RepID=A0A8S0WB87_CYCAE|nr:unnamed protein product [Cyclocybe aegerita]